MMTNNNSNGNGNVEEVIKEEWAGFLIVTEIGHVHNTCKSTK